MSSVWELFWPLLVGARLVIAKPDGHQDVTDLCDLLVKKGITTLHFVPPMLGVFLTESTIDRHSSLKKVMCSGQELPWELQQRFFAELPGVELHNLYGPTEASIDVTYWQCDESSTRRSVPIGHPIANTQIYILDADLNPVPIGVAGELHIAGSGLARGYLHRPDLTAEQFIANPFGEAGTRMYRSGDLARYLPDGNIEYLGRIDHQVKIRGFRIELGEIEAALTALPQIREAVVLAREDSPGEKRLAAYVVAQTGEEIEGSALRAALLRTLPEYMVPGHYLVLESLPLTSNGKIDRKALPAPEMARSEVGYVAPRTATEEVLAGIWAGVLKLDRVGIHDNFFALGGHSLLATQLVSQIRSAFQIELPLRAIFEIPSVEALAEQIEVVQRGHAVSTVPAIVAVDRSATLPLSFAQGRLWFLDQFEPGQAVYNMPLAVRLVGRLDVAALRATLNEIVRRHEALRTSFATIDGQPLQVIAAHQELDLLVTDLSSLPSDEREARARSLAHDEAQTAFDLSSGPLIRARLLGLDENDHVVLFTLHHIVSDGWSIGVLVREVAALYRAYVQHLPSPLAELAIQYADFAHWQRQWLQGEVLESQIGYWKERLVGAPTLALPTDRPRPAVQTHRGARHEFSVSAQTTAGLVALSLQTQSTMFMSLAAAFNVLLSRYSGQQDICIGTPIANRNRVEIEPLIGFFVNTLVLRTHVDSSVPFTDLLKQVRSTALGAYAHQDVPFEHLVDVLKPERHPSHAPLFQVMLILQNAPMGDLELPGLRLQTIASDTVTAKFDLTLSLTEGAGQLFGSFEYNTELFDQSTIERMAGHLTHLLEVIGADPSCRISELPLLNDAERRQLLVDWNDTAAIYPQAGRSMSCSRRRLSVRRVRLRWCSRISSSATGS